MGMANFYCVSKQNVNQIPHAEVIDQVQVLGSSKASGIVYSEGVWWPGMQVVPFLEFVDHHTLFFLWLSLRTLVSQGFISEIPGVEDTLKA